ncbi:MAG TPA: hypothetical protein PKC43_09555 [Phycisphaerales bacterium]|nr:hypothetical protein [Phycisphaerales bacterium]HMP37679.1 hypothetical protein [Phycisphaerales bacterium]
MRWRERTIRIAVVTAVSLVVWIWAARTTTDNATIKSTITVSLPPGRANEAVLMSPTRPFEVQLKARGLKTDVPRAELRLRDTALVIGERGVPLGAADDTTPFDAATLISILQGRLDDDGVDVRILELGGDVPPLLVEPLEQRTLVIGTNLIPISASAPPGALLIDRPPAVEPASVVVRGPRSLFRDGVIFRAEAVVEPAVFLGREPGRSFTDRVPIQIRTDPPGDLGARLARAPENAVVSYRIAERTETLVLGGEGSTGPGVPVQVALPAPDIGRFDVVIDSADAFLRNVTLRGSPEALEQVRQGRQTVIAFVQLSSNELDRAVLEGGTIVKQVGLWQLPSGISVADGGRTTRQIDALRDGLPPPAGVRVEVRRRGSA